MKNFLFSLLLLTSSIAWAQNNRMKIATPEEKTYRFLNLWTRELALTQDQQSKTKPGINKMFADLNLLRADTIMDKTTRKKCIQNTRKNGMDTFKATLTPDQVVLYNKKVQELKAKNNSHATQVAKKQKQGQNTGIKQAAKEELDSDDLF